MNKVIIFAIASALMGIAVAAHAVPREDVLECALPGGGRAILKAGYDWSPLAEIIPADVSKRLNQKPWSAEFQPGGGNRMRAPRTISHTSDGRACSRLGLIDGTPILNMSYLKPDGQWFNPVNLPVALLLSPETKTQPPTLRAQLQAMGVMPVLDYALILPRHGRLVYEMALFNTKLGAPRNVLAVFQSVSTDGGVNWSEPHITTQPEIYLLDQPPFRQPFQGRAVKLNGKEIRSE